MTNHINEAHIQQYLSASCEFSADLNTEGETYYNLLTAMEALRPSIIYCLAQVANDQKHFASLLTQATAASANIADAELIASHAIDDVPFDAAHRADAIWFLILLAAGQANADDEGWHDLRSTCRRLSGIQEVCK